MPLPHSSHSLPPHCVHSPLSTSADVCVYIYTHNGVLLSIKKNKFEALLVRWINLQPVIQSEISQKEKNKSHILTHKYGIQKNGTDEPTCGEGMLSCLIGALIPSRGPTLMSSSNRNYLPKALSLDTLTRCWGFSKRMYEVGRQKIQSATDGNTQFKEDSSLSGQLFQGFWFYKITLEVCIC